MRVGQVGFALSNVKSDGFGTASVGSKDEFEAMFRPWRRLRVWSTLSCCVLIIRPFQGRGGRGLVISDFRFSIGVEFF